MATTPRDLASRAQVVRLLADWDRLAGDGDPRVCIVAKDTECTGGRRGNRADRLAWASARLGRTVFSFSDLGKHETAYLIDCLNDKGTSLGQALEAEFTAAAAESSVYRIADREAWFAALANARGELGKFFGGRTLAELNYRQQARLLGILRARRGVARRP